MKPLRSLISAGLVVLSTLASTWDPPGHRIIAEIAWDHMTARARTRAIALILHGPPVASLASLRPGPEGGSDAERDRALFLNAATWADLVRNRARAWHVYNQPTWHYADFYWDVVDGRPHDLPGAGPGPVNAGERIAAFRATLVDPNSADTTKAIALAWLLHLVGDIHQPLHCSSRVTPEHPLPRGDQGGNLFYLSDSVRLHAYWDEMIDRAIAPGAGEDSFAYATRAAREVERRYTQASFDGAGATSDVAQWQREGLALAQTVVYAGLTQGAAPPPAYDRTAFDVAERQGALAGYRLAALLNAALDPPPAAK
ncbi:MAG TPA: S1/P1 nuclease [Gemmatimonadales bacterium]|nr:S1/P1 nuclease [Gemmatimonadales bacterium]